MAIDQAFYDSLRVASFGGVPFGVETMAETAGFQVAPQTLQASDIQPGGMRVLPRALNLQEDTFRAHLSSLTGPPSARVNRDALRDRQVLVDALNNRQPQTLIHPWKGALLARVCTDARLSIATRNERFVSMTLTFAPAEFPAPIPTPAGIPQTGDDARASMVAQSATFAEEPIPFDELLLSAEQLGTVGSTDEATATATTAKLVGNGNIEVSGVPSAVQQLGQATRAVDAGQYTTASRDILYASLLNIACARNSPTTLRLLQTFKLLLSGLGSAALANTVVATSGSLQSLAVAHGSTPSILAMRNRQIVQTWLPRGVVNL